MAAPNYPCKIQIGSGPPSLFQSYPPLAARLENFRPRDKSLKNVPKWTGRRHDDHGGF